MHRAKKKNHPMKMMTMNECEIKVNGVEHEEFACYLNYLRNFFLVQVMWINQFRSSALIIGSILRCNQYILLFHFCYSNCMMKKKLKKNLTVKRIKTIY